MGGARPLLACVLARMRAGVSSWTAKRRDVRSPIVAMSASASFSAAMDSVAARMAMIWRGRGGGSVVASHHTT